MHHVGSAGNTSNSVHQRKEKKFTYVRSDDDDTKHAKEMAVITFFTGSRDGTLKRWSLTEDSATCSATFESHVDWVNDAVVVGGTTLVSCSSDTTLKFVSLGSRPWSWIQNIVEEKSTSNQ